MTEDEPSQVEDAPRGRAGNVRRRRRSKSRRAFDFSDLRGFQQLDAGDPEDPEACAGRARQGARRRARNGSRNPSITSIVLASDGVIRWLGDPVGRLVGGEELLKPRAVLLADDALAGGKPRGGGAAAFALGRRAYAQGSGAAAGARGAPEGAPGCGRGARRQTDRQRSACSIATTCASRSRRSIRTRAAALRKLGVRFGAHYVFVPALLKPAARALCSQLWGLKHGGEPDADKLLASPRRAALRSRSTALLSPDAYRIAGFRLCGERVVRVDIVERLTDLIRAAIPDLMRPGGGSRRAAGFIVTQQMTSLTGCAGEAFASILRSLGFESHQVKKSEHEAAMRKRRVEGRRQPLSSSRRRRRGARGGGLGSA